MLKLWNQYLIEWISSLSKGALDIVKERHTQYGPLYGYVVQITTNNRCVKIICDWFFSWWILPFIFYFCHIYFTSAVITILFSYYHLFRSFLGNMGTLVVARDDLLREILIKQFSSFTNRRVRWNLTLEG